MRNTVHLGNNLAYLKTLPENSVDSVITDSPYGLGKEPDPVKLIKAWVETGYLEISGKGFMGKKWDAFVPQPILWKECFRILKPGGYLLSFFGTRTYDWGTLAIRLAGFEIRDCIQWIYGSGFPKSKAHLKPANEPICVARKPGPLNSIGIDECRIGSDQVEAGRNGRSECVSAAYGQALRSSPQVAFNTGRWPANLILDEETSSILDEQSGISGGDKRVRRLQRGSNGDITLTTHKDGDYTPSYNDTGGASRFFYCAKASPLERKGNPHPTVKPVKLMEHLVKLYCPEGGICVDPHAGSGTTGVACINTGRDYILIDEDEASIGTAKSRIEKADNTLFNQTPSGV